MTEETRGGFGLLRYDPKQRSLCLATGGREIQISGLAPEVAFQRRPNGEPA